MAVRILIVDDHPVVRGGLVAALRSHAGIEVIGEAENGAEAIELVESLRPDVVVMDLTMPRMDGITATRRIRETARDVKVLALTIHENEEYLIEFLRAGGAGYVFKRASVHEVVAAIQAVARGEAFLYPSTVTATIVDYLQRGPTRAENRDNLTAREWEILRLIAEGHSNQEIARLLHRSVKTIQAHRANLMRKLGLHDRTEIVRYAIRKGLIEP